MMRAVLFGSFVSALGLSVLASACTASDAGGGGADGGEVPEAATLDGARIEGDATNEAATTEASAPRGLRVSSEARGPLRGVDRGFGTESALRCPEGTLVVGVELVLPDHPSLLCAPVTADGSLGAETRVNGGFSAQGEATTVRCGAGEVATRLVGSFDSRNFTGLGLRCARPLDVIDGAPIGPGRPSTPALFGASAPNPFDDPCPNGAALSGLAYFAYADFSTGAPAGFGTATPLCRRILRDKSPSGLTLDARPFTLGPATREAPVKLVATAATPATPPTSTLDCPDGSVVTAVDGGASARSGPGAVAELQLTCRPLEPGATLGAETTKGRGVTNALVARCLEGQAVRALRFSVATQNLGAVTISYPEYGTPTCALPDAVDTPTPELGLPAVFPQAEPVADLDLTLSVTCGAGSLLTGVDLWVTPNDDGSPSSLHHVAAHCRPVRR